MKTELKPGRWEARSGEVWEIYFDRTSGLWLSVDGGWCWQSNGSYYRDGSECRYDLVRYLGPIELSPSPACAEAGPAGDPQTVSTEDPQESLRRMRRREAAIWRELEIYLPIVDALKTAASNLDEEIKRLEKEVEG